MMKPGTGDEMGVAGTGDEMGVAGNGDETRNW